MRLYADKKVQLLFCRRPGLQTLGYHNIKEILALCAALKRETVGQIGPSLRTARLGAVIAFVALVSLIAFVAFQRQRPRELLYICLAVGCHGYRQHSLTLRQRRRHRHRHRRLRRAVKLHKRRHAHRQPRDCAYARLYPALALIGGHAYARRRRHGLLRVALEDVAVVAECHRHSFGVGGVGRPYGRVVPPAFKFHFRYRACHTRHRRRYRVYIDKLRRDSVAGVVVVFPRPL